MARPSNRCTHVYEPEADLYKPYCCWREAWKGDKCIWHAAVWQKPAKLLRSARVAGRSSRPEQSSDRWVGSGGERFDGAILREADCKRLQFRRCTFFGADLSEADLRGADFTEADLRHANCSEVNAKQAILEGAVFREAELSGIDLEGANLSGADLRKANLEGANLREADLTGADLRRASLKGADLQGADLPGANLYDVDMSKAAIIEADLQGANLEGATLSDGHAMRADLRDAKLPEVDASAANFENASLAEAILVGANVADADLTDADLTEARATDADFSRANLESARLNRADCYDADVTDARLYGAVCGGMQVNEGTTIDRRVVYDPAEDGDLATDGGEGVDDLTKAAGTYRILEAVARENELPDRRVQYDLRRRDVRRQKHRQDGNWLRWARSKAASVSVRYGERPSRVVAAGLAVIVAFGLLYPFSMLAGPNGELINYSEPSVEMLAVLGEGLYFSAVTFATGSTAHQAVGLGQLLAAVEGFLGVLAFALLVYSFARRASR